MIAPEPFFKIRGTPFSVFHRCRALTSLGYEVDLITYHLGENVDMKGLNVIRSPRFKFIKNVPIGFSIQKMFLWWILLGMAYQRLKQFDYLCVHTHEDAVFMGVVLRKMFGITHVYDMHSSLPQQFENYKTTSSKAFLKFAYMMERMALKNSDAVITICSSLFEHAKSVNRENFKALIENVSSTIGCSADDEQVKNLKEELGIIGEKAVIYTGTLENNQGIDLMIDAFAEAVDLIPPAKLIIVGGEPEQAEFYRRYAEKRNIANKVLLTGKMPVETMAVFMKIADILVSPRSIGTNTPLKIYTYLEAGKPILATNLKTHTQVLSKDDSYLAKPTVEGLKEGLVRLMNDENLRFKLSKGARSLFENSYSDEMFVAKTKKFYEKALSLMK